MPKRTGESGFALLFVFALAAAAAFALYIELPRVAFEEQRAKEQLLIDRGEQYQRAIQLFYRKHKRYPTTLEQLEKSDNVRYLRKRYKDPMTGEEEWRIVHIGPGGVLTDSLVQKPPDPAKGGQQSASSGSAFGSAFGASSGSSFGASSGSSFGTSSGFGASSGFGSSSGMSAFGSTSGSSMFSSSSGTSSSAQTGSSSAYASQQASAGSNTGQESRASRWRRPRRGDPQDSGNDSGYVATAQPYQPNSPYVAPQGGSGGSLYQAPVNTAPSQPTQPPSQYEQQQAANPSPQGPGTVQGVPQPQQNNPGFPFAPGQGQPGVATQGQAQPQGFVYGQSQPGRPQPGFPFGQTPQAQVQPGQSPPSPFAGQPAQPQVAFMNPQGQPGQPQPIGQPFQQVTSQTAAPGQPYSIGGGFPGANTPTASGPNVYPSIVPGGPGAPNPQSPQNMGTFGAAPAYPGQQNPPMGQQAQPPYGVPQYPQPQPAQQYPVYGQPPAPQPQYGQQQPNNPQQYTPQPYNPQQNSPQQYSPQQYSGSSGARPPAQTPSNPALDAINNQLRGSAPPSGFQGGATIGGGIAGVASKYEAEGIKVYNEKTKYNEWEFVYDLRKDARWGMAPVGAQPARPGSLGQPPSNSGNFGK